MYRNLLLAGLCVLALACNDHSSHQQAGTDSTGHANHGKTSQDRANAITASMNTMMREMHNIKPTGNNEIDFATMMIQHHKGAVDMSAIELAQGKDTALKAFAQKLIDDQDREIRFMEAYISKSAKTSSENTAAFQEALNGSMKAMMENHPEVYNDIDKDYATQMIPHHQSAVDMAKAYLQFGKNPELTTLCRNIIGSQEKEIGWLRRR